MKKTRKALLAVLACSVALAGAAGLAACGGGDDGDGNAHQHAWGNWTVSTQPTNEATGKATRTCTGEGTCDAAATDKEYTLPVLTATDYTKGEDTATCAAAGTVTYTYDKGGVNVSFDVATAAKAHTEVAIQGKAATCNEDGLTEGKKCSVCGEITVAQTTIAAHHTEFILTEKYATCTAEGLTEGKQCSICGEITVEQKTRTAIGHAEGILPAVEATCTENGLTEGIKCSVCNTILEAQTVVPATGHALSTTLTPTVNETDKTVSQRCTVCNKSIFYEYDHAVSASGTTLAAASALSATLDSTGENYSGVNYVTQGATNPVLGYTFEKDGTYTIYWESLNNSTFNINTVTLGTSNQSFINSSKSIVKANLPEDFAIEGYCTSNLQYYVDNVSTTAQAGDYITLTKDNFQSSQTQLGISSFVPVKLTFTTTAGKTLKFKNVTTATGGCFLIGINKKPAIVAEYCTVAEGDFSINGTELEFMPVTEQGTYTFTAPVGTFQLYVNDVLYSVGEKTSFGYVGFSDRYLTVTLQEGDEVKVVKRSTKASEKTIKIYEGTIDEPAAPVYRTLGLGESTITLSATGTGNGKYEDGTEQYFSFTAAESGYYKLSVADGVKVSAAIRVDKTHFTTVVDVGNMNKSSGVFRAEAGEIVVLMFIGNDALEFGVNIEPSEEEIIKLKANEKLENVSFAAFETINKITIDDSVAEGTYELTFKVSNSLLRSYIYFSVNDEIQVDDLYDSNAIANAYVNADLRAGANNTVGAATRSKVLDEEDYKKKEEYDAAVEYVDFTRTVTVKAGDVLYLATTATISGYVSITLTPVE